MARTTRSTPAPAPAPALVSAKVTPAQLKANAAQRAAKLAQRNGGGNPATTTSPVTGKRQGPPRKPLLARNTVAKDAVTKAAVTTVVGTMGTRTSGTPAKAPARTRKVAAPAPAPAKPAPAKRTAKPRDVLPQAMLVAVTTWAQQAKLSPQDQQRVANYCKVVTSGSNAAGARWWPTAQDLPRGVKPLPRPSHHSWAPLP